MRETARQIHRDQGYDHDPKYSRWRREVFPQKAQKDNAYCMDIDWLEWRQGHPVALIECRRAIGSLKTAEDVIEHFKTLNNGFQFEALARMSLDLKIKAYIVAIEDNSSESNDYSNARFIVERIFPPAPKADGRIDVKAIRTKRKEMTEDEYVQFIKELQR